jgi:phosphohistidine phosphatase
MTIYLLRHGIAEPAGPGGSDAARALTDEGRKKLRAVLKLANHAGVKPDLILTSPLVRAFQTAEVAAEALGYGSKPTRTRVLELGGPVEEVWDEIRIHKDANSVMLMGHEPQFSQLAADLLGTPELIVDFKKGALIAIDLEQLGPRPRGVLRWMLVPKLAGKVE